MQANLQWFPAVVSLCSSHYKPLSQNWVGNVSKRLSLKDEIFQIFLSDKACRTLLQLINDISVKYTLFNFFFGHTHIILLKDSLRQYN